VTSGRAVRSPLMTPALIAGIITAAILALGTMSTTRAAFSATTTPDSASWATGTVSVTANAGGSALFTATNLATGATNSNCLVVTYTGSVTPADLRLWISATGSMANGLDAVIDLGTGGSAGSCTGFVKSSTLASDSLANLAATYSSFVTGQDLWTATASGQTRTLRVTTTVVDESAASSKTAAATITIEAQT